MGSLEFFRIFASKFVYYMQIKVVAPKEIGGRIVLPASKSISNRALTIGALAGSNETVENVSDCDDTRVMQAWLRERPGTIDIGAAGTAMRFSTALLAVSEGTHVITGSERMKNRPIGIWWMHYGSWAHKLSMWRKKIFHPFRLLEILVYKVEKFTCRAVSVHSMFLPC